MNQTRLRYPLVILSIFALLAALWAGLLRLGWQWPLLQSALPIAHGPLMVSGFLGTLIGVERAVALRTRWAYLGPALSGLGGFLLVMGVPGLPGPLMVSLGSLALVVIFTIIVRRHPAFYTVVMGLGALSWLIGNLLWLSGRPVHQAVLWWAGFLVLTIAGERLELGHLARLSRNVELAFLGAAGVFLVGLVVTIPDLGLGTRLAGLGILALAIWLLRYDVARRTLRKAGLPRYAAACLLSGYVWLAAAGFMGLIFGAVYAGPRYDALLHAIFLGFTFSMIFGHAPIILPAILGRPAVFYPVLYVHLVLLHGSLLVRVISDLANNYPTRLWGGLLNGVALLVFMALTAFTVIRARGSSII